MVKTTVGVEGMMCPKCEAHVNELIAKTFSVKEVTSSHKSNQTVIISDEELDETKLKEAIDSLGYKTVAINKEEYRKKVFIYLDKTE